MMGTDSGHLIPMQQMTAWGSDENGLEFTDRGKDRCR